MHRMDCLTTHHLDRPSGNYMFLLSDLLEEVLMLKKSTHKTASSQNELISHNKTKVVMYLAYAHVSCK